jgi:plastocyanin
MVFAVNPGDQFEAFKAAATGGVPAGSSTVSGQPTGSYPSATPTTSSSTDHRIIVGGPGKLAFEPSNIAAQAGDTVTFEFRQKNHTVTASTFAAPCRALSLTSTTGEIGFDSGFMAVADGATSFPTYTIQVNDTKPIWSYCRQGNHCGQGMVFSVNAVENGPQNFAAFQAQAMQLNGTGQSGTGSGNHASLSFNTQGAGALLVLTGLIVTLL